MHVNVFYSSLSSSCGISIFNRHLCKALLSYNINVLETNLRHSWLTNRSSISLLHYLPSGFISGEASNALDVLLESFNCDEKLCVILHGVHARGETRFQQDGVSPWQARHIRSILQRANCIVALSESVAEACSTWQAMFGYRGRFVRLDHPGLFAPLPHRVLGHEYALLGGISRPKKDYASSRIRSLVDQCEDVGIRVWQHWTNALNPVLRPTSWRHSAGLLTDVQWATIVSGAKAVLCPYQTRIQSVSGIIAEALSAQRFVLATSFDVAREMQRRVPLLVHVEDDLERWPEILLRLPSSPSAHDFEAPPTWASFARHLASELFRLTTLKFNPGDSRLEGVSVQNKSFGQRASTSGIVS